MHKKKYITLIIPALFLSILGILYLPERYKNYSFLILVLAWTIYYIWIYFEKRKIRSKTE
ncbi:hypothetical protein BLX88_07055 [Bacillus obstructivus]|nr:hypothetical protein BLX88_07055 [Bacillus obstructivus]